MDIRTALRLELARKDFYTFCQIKAPDFYLEDDRLYLQDLCENFEEFYRSETEEVMVVTLPPRHGKTRTATNFVQWIYGQNKQEKVMSGSYNETLSTVFSKNVRDSIQEVKFDPNVLVYKDIFPGINIKHGEGAMNYWTLDGAYSSYLATSPGGTSTGLGCSLMIIDDLIKNHLEAANENVLEQHWDWFSKTMLSRLEQGGKIILIMTRWSSKDLIGRALEHFKEEGKVIREVNYKAHQGSGVMLCPEILSYANYKSKERAMGIETASAVYQQEPIDKKGRLYTSVKTYAAAPEFEEIRSYTDTADEGKDFLCGIVYGVYQRQAYIIDVLYSKAAMEYTEESLAAMLHDTGCHYAKIESNNGGRGFARSVARILLEKYNTRQPFVDWFFQSKNKIARILSASTFVMNNIYFPVNWETRWPEFARDIKAYQRAGKNKNDDGPDTLSGIAEDFDVAPVKLRATSVRGGRR